MDDINVIQSDRMFGVQSRSKVTRTFVILRFLYAAVYACVIQRYFYALQSAFQ